MPSRAGFDILTHGGGNRRSVHTPCLDSVRLLRNKGILPKHQARGYPSHTDVGGIALYVLRTEGLLGRLRAMDETGGGVMPYGVYADNAPISRTLDIPDQYAHGLGYHACGRRSTEDCTAVRYGHIHEIQRDERSPRNDDGD